MRRRDKSRNVNIPAFKLLQEEQGEYNDEKLSVDNFKQEAIYTKISRKHDIGSFEDSDKIEYDSNIDFVDNQRSAVRISQGDEKMEDNDDISREDFIRLGSDESEGVLLDPSNANPIDDGRLPVTEQEQIRQDLERKKEMEEAFNDL